MPRIAALLAFMLFGSAAHASEPSQHGRALLQEYCARCHSIGKTGDSRDPEAPPLRTLGRSFDLDAFPRVLERGISSDHPDMPEFKFSEDDARAVRAYLRTIQR